MTYPINESFAYANRFATTIAIIGVFKAAAIIRGYPTFCCLCIKLVDHQLQISLARGHSILMRSVIAAARPW